MMALRAKWKSGSPNWLQESRGFMFKFFKKKDDIFHSLIEEQAEMTYRGLKLLVKYMGKKDSSIDEKFNHEGKRS